MNDDYLAWDVKVGVSKILQLTKNNLRIMQNRKEILSLIKILFGLYITISLLFISNLNATILQGLILSVIIFISTIIIILILVFAAIVNDIGMLKNTTIHFELSNNGIIKNNRILSWKDFGSYTTKQKILDKIYLGLKSMHPETPSPSAEDTLYEFIYLQKSGGVFRSNLILLFDDLDTYRKALVIVIKHLPMKP